MGLQMSQIFLRDFVFTSESPHYFFFLINIYPGASNLAELQ